MKVSVIIPAYNEEKTIGECLKYLTKQTYKNFEIIVVDDGSTDKTLKILQELKNKNLKLKIVHGKHSGTGAARNLGAKKATGEILVFVDADMIFEKNFLKKLTLPIILGKAKGTFSKEEYVSNWNNVWARCWNINENWPKKRRHPKNYPDFQPVFRAILKSEFNKVNGFIPGGYDDDWSLSTKLGYKAKNVKGAIFYHKNPEKLLEVYKHAKWVGKRKYKAGYIGYILALARASMPVSLLLGFLKGLKNRDLRFLIFKIVYDFGLTVGVLEMILKGKMSK